jgi:quercetin dioxygenase-like cupin family protein
MVPKNEPEIKRIEGLKEEYFGEVFRRVFFSPQTTGNRFLKMAYIDVPPGAVGMPHVHLGEEMVYTIKGRAIIRVDGREFLLEEGTCFLIPPDVEHPVHVVGRENWVAVAAYCDECPVLKKALSKEDMEYPLSKKKNVESI